MGIRRGQALIEMAAGMLALALVLAALVSFSSIILASLGMQGTLRREAGVEALNGFGSDPVLKKGCENAEVSSLVIGRETFRVREKVAIPNMGGLLQ